MPYADPLAGISPADYAPRMRARRRAPALGAYGMMPGAYGAPTLSPKDDPLYGTIDPVRPLYPPGKDPNAPIIEPVRPAQMPRRTMPAGGQGVYGPPRRRY